MKTIQSDVHNLIRCNSLFRSRHQTDIRRGPTTIHLRAVSEKPEACTGDELHYVSTPNSSWRLALWRYLPAADATKRDHPLLLLGGVGTNAIGYDLSPESSFARYMSGHGFDTWILEARGAGLSRRQAEHVESGQPANPLDKEIVEEWTKARETSMTDAQVDGLGLRFRNSIQGQLSASALLLDLHERLSRIARDVRKQLDLFMDNGWDFDHCLKEDIPAVMEYIKAESKPRDGKLLAIGHSMGGILLYGMLSLCGFEGRESGLAAAITLASSLDYTSSKSSLKLLLPFAEPAQALKVSSIPMGVLLAAIHPLASRPPYVLSWLNLQISAQDMMMPKLLEKLVLKNFGTVPAKLLLQLTTAFQTGGLSSRDGTFFYKNHLHKSNVPIMALAGDQDLICPPEAVYETVKVMNKQLTTFRVFGEPGGPHYAHYDLVGSRLASKEVYPTIINFLAAHDRI